MLDPFVAWVAVGVGLAALAALVVLLYGLWIRRKLPPLRGEPVYFPAIPTVPVDAEAQREIARLADEREAKAMDALEHAEERRRRRAQRKQNLRIPRAR